MINACMKSYIMEWSLYDEYQGDPLDWKDPKPEALFETYFSRLLHSLPPSAPEVSFSIQPGPQVSNQLYAEAYYPFVEVTHTWRCRLRFHAGHPELYRAMGTSLRIISTLWSLIY